MLLWLILKSCTIDRGNSQHMRRRKKDETFKSTHWRPASAQCNSTFSVYIAKSSKWPHISHHHHHHVPSPRHIECFLVFPTIHINRSPSTDDWERMKMAISALCVSSRRAATGNPLKYNFCHFTKYCKNTTPCMKESLWAHSEGAHKHTANF